MKKTQIVAVVVFALLSTLLIAGQTVEAAKANFRPAINLIPQSTLHITHLR